MPTESTTGVLGQCGCCGQGNCICCYMLVLKQTGTGSGTLSIVNEVGSTTGPITVNSTLKAIMVSGTDANCDEVKTALESEFGAPNVIDGRSPDDPSPCPWDIVGTLLFSNTSSPYALIAKGWKAV